MVLGVDNHGRGENRSLVEELKAKFNYKINSF